MHKNHNVYIMHCILSDLGDSEFDIFTDDDGRPTVEICLDDFNPNYEIQLGVESEVWSGVVSTNSANSYLFVIVLMLSVQAIRGPTF